MKKSSHNKGFTLIELVIVMVIGGVLLAAGAQALATYTKNINRKVTKDRIAVIAEQIELYLDENGRLPCVARRNDAVGSPTFGRALDDDGVPGGAVGCTLSSPAPPAPPAVVRSSGGNVFIGAVPTRTLNLPDSFMVDGWGNRILYAVTRVQTNTFLAGDGAIDIRDTNNNPVVLPVGEADFIIYSSGDNRRGGWTLSGTGTGVACSAVGNAQNDQENCDGDHVFATTMLTAEGNAANQYDDIVQYRRISSKNIVIPADAVVPIERIGPLADTCPSGWAKPIPALPNNGNLVYCKKR